MPAAFAPGSVVAVIGAGAMGAGIAQLAALHGHRVQLHDTRFGAAEQAKQGIATALEKEVARGRLEAGAAAAALARIATLVTLPDACLASLVIEAIVEDLAAKRELFAQLAHFVATDCVLASNTSSLSITALAAGIRHPERVVGMHFFNPAPLLPLVEVVTGLATSPQVADRVFHTAAAWGKTPVHAASTPGFIVNRCARPFYAEALRLYTERAADPATIDAVMREAGGFRMGPFELMDLIGHDVNFAVTCSVWEAFFHDPRFAPSVAQQELVAAGFLGRKSGRGFYDYAPTAVRPPPRSEPAQPLPPRVVVHGAPGAAAALPQRMAAGGVAVEEGLPESRFFGPVLHVGGREGGVWLAPTDGRTATMRAVAAGVRDVVVFDLALDYATTTRLAVARADTCSDEALALAVGALRAAGIAASRFDDVPALAVMRTVAMLANEAADAVVQGVAGPVAVDLALQKGVAYPRGPLAWADALGVAAVRDVLVHLAGHYGEDRYRLSPLIARRAATGGRLHG
ncbi:MAG: 3-hydroxyacyl-CoA dehydrogenase [Betaproteobacteria bacterium]|nr:3-hydroxyacyl-CoA dehydrogenase [Betaproteobacteria bacterium]